MTTKILSGTYPDGYTLSSNYSTLSITSTGKVDGRAGAAGGAGDPGGMGGVGVTIFDATVVNQGQVVGGVGGTGGKAYTGGAGGSGGVGLDFIALGAFSNLAGTITGGAGGTGGFGDFYYGGAGGAGGAGVYMRGGGSVTIAGGAVAGGRGGMGGEAYSLLGSTGTGGGAGARGGAGLYMVGGGPVTISNGSVLGGQGGAGGDEGITYEGPGGAGGTGGVGVFLAHGGALTSSGGSITGGEGGNGGDGLATDDSGGAGGAGGAGIELAKAGALGISAGAIAGGQGGVGGNPYAGGNYGAGGAGGVGVDLKAKAILTITGGAITGGKGGYGVDSPGAGGAGLVLAAGGSSVTNAGEIRGGEGGFGGGYSGGAAGAGVDMLNRGMLTNGGMIDGGQGGSSFFYGNGVAGGDGVAVSAAASIDNSGVIAGGAGAAGHDGGTGGAGIELSGGGAVTNNGSILGGAGGVGHGTGGEDGVTGTAIRLAAGGSIVNGAAAVNSALIEGSVGLYAGPAGAATVTNFGTIDGTGGVGVALKSKDDRLIAQSGSSVIGAVQGGGGTLELAAAAGTIVGLGGIGELSGGEVMTFNGFGSYEIDTKDAWTLAVGDAVAAGVTVIDKGTLTNIGALTLAGTVAGTGTLTLAAGSETIEAGTALLVSRWSLTGGTADLEESLAYAGRFPTQGAEATLTVADGGKLTLSGEAELGGTLNGAGTIGASQATLGDLVVGGTTKLSVIGVQTGQVTVGDATTAAATLWVAEGSYTIEGAVGIARGAAAGSGLHVAGTLIRSGKGTSIVAVNTDDADSIEALSGALDFTAALTGSGTMTVEAGATLEADAAVASTLAANFAGDNGVLAMKDPSAFAASIAAFAPTDAIDLLKIKATSAVLGAHDTLVITDGSASVATLNLSGPYKGDTFTTASDGHGGAEITVTAAAQLSAPPAWSPHAFITALARMGATSEAAHAVFGPPPDVGRPVLATP